MDLVKLLRSLEEFVFEAIALLLPDDAPEGRLRSHTF